MLLRKGSQGPEVVAWQTWLKSRKIDLDIDGDFWTETEDATKLWQGRAGVKVTGQVDAATLAAAKKLGFAAEITFKPVVTPSPSHLDVFEGSKIDKINAAHLAKVAPTLQRRARLFIDAAKQDGVIVQIVQGLRTFAEQDALFAKGRTKPGKRVTNARGGQSLHNYGLALDFAPVIDGKVSWDEKHFKIFDKWEEIAGLEWGGHWKFVDLPHVQDDEGMTLAEIQTIYKKGGLAAVWAKVK